MRAKRTSGVPWVRKWDNLPIRENMVITWPYTDRPSVRTTGIPMFTLTHSNYFGSPLIAHQCCEQLTAVKTRYTLASITWPYRGLRCRPIQFEYFSEVIRWQVTSFQMIAGSFLIHMKYVVFISLRPSAINILISVKKSREDAFHFSHHSHALVTLHVQFLRYNWSKFDVSSYEKFMPHLATCSLWQP